MRAIRWAMAAGLMASTAALGARPRNVSFETRLRLGYDDNVNRTEEDRQGSFTTAAGATVSSALRLNRAFLSLRYSAGLTWYENRRSDQDIDWTHSVDFTWNQTLSRRLSFGITDAFRYVDRPEVFRDDGVTLQRRDATYFYNSLHATLSSVLTTRARLDTSGRYILLRYHERVAAEREDYNTLVGGLTLRGQFTPDTSGLLDARAERIDYPKAKRVQVDPIEMPGADEDVVNRVVPDRSADTLSFGLGIDQVFSPGMVGLFRVGVTHKAYAAANTGSSTGPYAEANLTLLPNPGFRVALGISHSLYQSSVVSYVNQRRTAGTLRLGHDLTARLQANLSAALVFSRYDEDESVDELAVDEVRDGDETAVTFGARLSYRLGHRNRHWLEAGWSRTDLASQIRDDYYRNVYDLAWRMRL